MRYVIDSSVAFKWVVPEPHSDKAIRLRDDFRTGVRELLAPDVSPIEVGHALTRAERQGRIPKGTSIPLLRDVLNACGGPHCLDQKPAILSYSSPARLAGPPYTSAGVR